MYVDAALSRRAPVVVLRDPGREVCVRLWLLLAQPGPGRATAVQTGDQTPPSIEAGVARGTHRIRGPARSVGTGCATGGSCTPALPSGGNRATHHVPVCGRRFPDLTRCVEPGRCSHPGSRRPGLVGRASATPARPSCSTRGRDPHAVGVSPQRRHVPDGGTPSGTPVGWR